MIMDWDDSEGINNFVRCDNITVDFLELVQNFYRCTEVYEGKIAWYLGLPSKFSSHEQKIWQNLDNFSLGDGYMKAYCIILSMSKYVWKFHTKTV